MADPADKRQLDALEQRIEALKEARRPAPRRQGAASQAQYAWRMVIELVVGIAIGAGMGYGLDVLFGTSPWFLVPFTILGFAAGVNVILQTAKEMQGAMAGRAGARAGAAADKGGDDAGDDETAAGAGPGAGRKEEEG